MTGTATATPTKDSLRKVTTAAPPLGFILSAGVIALVAGSTTQAQFASWGWRVPFLISALLVITGLYIRLRLEESTLFQQLVSGQSAEKPLKFPLVGLLRRYPRMVLVSIVVPIGVHGGYYLTSIFGLSYARGTVGYSNSDSLVILIVASLIYVPAILAAGALSDRFGRRPPMLVGLFAFGCWSFALFPLLDRYASTVPISGYALAICLLAAAFLAVGRRTPGGMDDTLHIAPRTVGVPS